jgi:hypothetical protein
MNGIHWSTQYRLTQAGFRQLILHSQELSRTEHIRRKVISENAVVYRFRPILILSLRSFSNWFLWNLISHTSQYSVCDCWPDPKRKSRHIQTEMELWNKSLSFFWEELNSNQLPGRPARWFPGPRFVSSMLETGEISAFMWQAREQ